MRFNPNSLPSSTNVRFAILAATVTFMAIWYGTRLPETLRFINNYSGSLSLSAALKLTGLVWGGALILYLLHPISSGWRFRSGSDVKGATDLVEAVETTCLQFGLKRVRVLVNDDITDLEAKAFGLPFFRRVAFGKRNILFHAKAPEAFQAKLVHEIGHIINSDVDIAYISQALVRTSYFFLLAVTAYWFANFFQDPPIDSLLLPALMIGGFSLIASALFWFGLIFLENREFVRQREFMADAEAAFHTSPHAVRLALGGEEHDKPRGYLWSTLSLHPTIASRLATLADMTKAGFPDWKLMLISGYLLSIYESVAATVAGTYPADDRVSGWTYQGSGSIDDLLEIFWANPAYFYVVGLTAVTMQIIFVLLASTAMRAGIQARLRGVKIIKYLRTAVVLSVVFCVGYYIGDKIDPFYVSNLFVSNFTRVSIDFGGVHVTDLFKHGAVILFPMICYYAIGRYLTEGRRKKRVSQTTWFLSAGLHFVAAAQLIISSYIYFQVMTRTDFRPLDSEEISGLIGTAGGILFWWTWALACCYVIRNGFAFRGTKADQSDRPGWLSGSVQ